MILPPTALPQAWPQLVVKRLELLHKLLPKATEIASIVNPGGPPAESELRVAKEPPGSFGQQVRVVNPTSTQEIGAVESLNLRVTPHAASTLVTTSRANRQLSVTEARPGHSNCQEAVNWPWFSFDGTPRAWRLVRALSHYYSCSAALDRANSTATCQRIDR